MKLYSAIDLHSSNHVLTVIDETDRKVYERRFGNDIELTLRALEPFHESIEGIAVESTYNWYWLVDGLADAGYEVHLVNTSAIQQYEGLKHTDDEHDAFWLAHLLRLGILPTGYIYPPQQRAIRDLLRKRSMLVRERTMHTLSAISLFSRLTGKQASSQVIQGTRAASIYLPHITDANRRLEMQNSLQAIRFLERQISKIESTLLAQVKTTAEFLGLKQVPGIGDILALTIMLETGEISRFANAGCYASYCRAVKSERISNGKVKGRGNRKNGNRYLGWAFVEAANLSIRHCDSAKRFFQRKLAQRNRAVAVKALANKLAKACFYIMRDGAKFEPALLFR